MHKIAVELNTNILKIVENEGNFEPSANQVSQMIKIMKSKGYKKASFKIASDGKTITIVKGEKMAQRKELSTEAIIKIYLDATSGKSLSEVAKEYGVSVSTVRRIKNKELKKYADAIDMYFNALEKQEQQEQTEKQVETENNDNYFDFVIPDEEAAKALAQLPELTATLPNGMKIIIIVEE